MEPAQPSNHYHYNKHLQPRANQLRKEMPKGEACLWKYLLSRKQMLGYAFRRQRPILRYIVDFVCFELMLVIEVDGISHDDPLAEKKDKARDSELGAVGFSVLRFSDWEVLHQLPEVSLLIQDWIAKNKH